MGHVRVPRNFGSSWKARVRVRGTRGCSPVYLLTEFGFVVVGHVESSQSKISSMFRSL